MVKLLIIADDFTGALDTGVQFAARGAATRVITDPAFAFAGAEPGLQVLVLDAETRHVAPEQAYAVVRRMWNVFTKRPIRRCGAISGQSWLP